MTEMTATEFVAKIREFAKQQPALIIAVDFEPARDGSLKFTLHYQHEVEDDAPGTRSTR